MGFGAPAALGAKLARPDRVVVSLVGDGGFGQNPAVLATAVEQDTAVVWVVMNNLAYGTIAGLEKAHFGTTFGTVFRRNERTVLAGLRRCREGLRRRRVPHRVRRTVSSLRSNTPSLRQTLSCSTSSWKMRPYLRRDTGTSWTSIPRIRSERTSRREPKAPRARSVVLPEQDATEECHAEPDTKKQESFACAGGCGAPGFDAAIFQARAQIVETPIPGDPLTIDSGQVSGKLLAIGRARVLRRAIRGAADRRSALA